MNQRSEFKPSASAPAASEPSSIGEIKPINDIDVITQGPINDDSVPKKYQIVLEKYLFDIRTLIPWCNTKNAMHNPFTGKNFGAEAEKNIRAQAAKLLDDSSVPKILVADGRLAPLSEAAETAIAFDPLTVPDNAPVHTPLAAPVPPYTAQAISRGLEFKTASVPFLYDDFVTEQLNMTREELEALMNSSNIVVVPAGRTADGRLLARFSIFDASPNNFYSSAPSSLTRMFGLPR